MPEPSVLGQLALGYSPMIDGRRAVAATRLTVFAARPEAAPDAAALLQALAGVWPGIAGGELTLRPLDGRAGAPPTPTPAPAPLVSLNVADEALLRAALRLRPGLQLMIEVPAFIAADPAQAAALQALHAHGTPLLLKGRLLEPLAAPVLACFSHRIADGGEPEAPQRMTMLHAGVRSSAEAEAAFRQGAAAVFGWPFDDPPPAAGVRGKSGKSGNDAQTVLELMQGVDREAPLPRLEAVLKRDPTLAFKLMRYLNSAAFGLTVEINSFGQALMLLGYQRLKRWLALLLATSGQSPYAQPLVHAAVRRGLLMEELARDRGDAVLRGEMFICGIFSLLDRLLEQALPELLQNVPVPDAVQQALRGEGGPHAPYLQLVQAIEQESAFDIREGSDRLLLSAAEVNRAVLAALQAARQLDG